MKRYARAITLAVINACTLLACGGGEGEDLSATASEELKEDVGDIASSDPQTIQSGLDAPTADEQASGGPAPSALPPLELYIATSGNDQADGSAQSPLATLMGAQARLQGLYPSGHPLERNVEVRITPGTYRGQEVRWEFPSSGRSITFMPSGFAAGMKFPEVKALGGRPIFDGQRACAKASAGASCKFLLIDQPKTSGPSRLRFYYLDVRNYATTGIGLHNNGDGLNLVWGCRFSDIGTYPAAFRKLLHGMAAVGLSDSDHNVVQNNHFVNIRNQGTDERFLHAVYLNVMSDNNRVADNLTFRVSGDPIKVREFSNHNEIVRNTLRCSGGKSFLLDYPEDFPAGSGRQDECASWENQFRDNTLDCGYDGSGLLTTFAEPGRACGAKPSWQRFHVSGNTNACRASCR